MFWRALKLFILFFKIHPDHNPKPNCSRLQYVYFGLRIYKGRFAFTRLIRFGVRLFQWHSLAYPYV